MRSPSLRVALAGIAAVAVLAGGSLATRHGPIGGSPRPDGSDTTSTAAADVASASARLGTMSERLARLPAVPPGELAGTLGFADDNGCWQLTLDLATLRTSAPPGGVCFATGGRAGVADFFGPLDPVRVVGLDGRTTDTIARPDGWDVWGVTRDGIVFCNFAAGDAARIRRFGRTWAPLPACPIANGRDGLLFRGGPKGRSIVDERGRRVAALPHALDEFLRIRTLGDALLVIDSGLYGEGRLPGSYLYADGRLLQSYRDPGGTVLSASRDGGVVLFATDRRLVVYRDGTAHPIDGTVATRGGVLSPDGTMLLVQHEQDLLILLDAVTLRPLARLPIHARANLRDWRSASVPGTGRDAAR